MFDKFNYFVQNLLESPNRVRIQLDLDSPDRDDYDERDFLESIQLPVYNSSNVLHLDVMELLDENEFGHGIKDDFRNLKFYLKGTKNLIAEVLYEEFPLDGGIREMVIVRKLQKDKTGYDPYRDLIRSIYVNYLMKKYKYIQSDTSWTDRGFNFWKKLIREESDKFNFCAFDLENNKVIAEIEDSNDLTKYFSDDKRTRYIVIMMERKK